MNWSLLPGVLIQYVVTLAALSFLVYLAVQFERDRQHRKARAFYAALNRDLASISPDVCERDRHILRSYQTEVWGPLR